MTHAHFIGIGGSGLSAIARLLQESGYTVTGSDRDHSTFVDDLRAIGITVHIGHDAAQIKGADLIVRSSAIPATNPEVQAALEAGIPVYKRSDFLGQLMEEKIGIAIAGTHGKTSTTAMMAWTLTALQQDPSFIVGGVINGLNVNAHAGAGNTFVIEADEYDRMFLGLKPTIGIVTNLEHDHPDIYPTAESFHAAFMEFIHLIPEKGVLIACGDDWGAADLIKEAQQANINTLAYSLNDVENLQPNTTGGFDFYFKKNHISLQVPGKHNVLNALAVLKVIEYLGLSLENAAKALGDYSGSGRRFELIGKVNGITIYDDYAHHPTEIRATLAGARTRHPRARIWAVWQPHTYSRTQMLFDKFSRAFSDADEIIVTEIYASREAKQDFSSAEVVTAMKNSSAKFIAELNETGNYLIENLRPNDVLLILSAGDANEVSKKVFTVLSEKAEVSS